MLRFGLDSLIERRASSDFPLGTLAINLSGAFVLGALSAARIGATSMFVVGVGLLGSYTTFSTWIFESEQLVADGEYVLAASNLVLGAAAGFGLALAGWKIGAAL